MSSSGTTFTIATKHSSGEICCIKKFAEVGSNIIKAKTCLRELKILYHLRSHKNILCLYDMDFDLDTPQRLADVYSYTELPRSNIATLINNKKTLSHDHVQFVMYQLMCALKYIHSAGIIHSNVQPSSVLINPDTSIRLSGFQYARAYDAQHITTIPRTSTDTILYQAPELLLGASKTSCGTVHLHLEGTEYPAAVDVWSAGCILAELVNGAPTFDRKDLPGQIRCIIGRLGTPPETVLTRIASPQTARNLRDMQRQEVPPLGQSIKNMNPLELEVLEKTLLWDPLRRAKASALLDCGYFASWRSAEDEAVCSKVFSSGFEQESSQEAVNHMIMTEVSQFRETVRRETLTEVRASRQRFDPGLTEADVDVSDEDGEFEWDTNTITHPSTSYL